jgi:hypothetical protein
VFSQGCAVALVGAGAGTVAYIRGSLVAFVEADVAGTYAATLAAFEDLGIPVQKKQQDALVAEVSGRTAEDKKVTVKIKAAEQKTSRIAIKIGWFGDQSQSQVIYEAIKKRL